jgi:hypothetical protein
VRKGMAGRLAAALLVALLLAFPAATLVFPAPPVAAAPSSSRQTRPPLPAEPSARSGQLWRQVIDAPYSATLLPHKSYRCPAWRRRWVRSDGASVAILVWTCERANDAAVGLWLALFFTGGKVGVGYTYHPLAQIPNAWTASERAGPATGGQREATVFVARGRYVLAASARLPDSVSGSPVTIAAQAIREESGLIRGRNYRFTPPPLISKAFSNLVAALLVVYLVVIGVRYGRNSLRRQRYEVRSGDVHWVDMTSQATRLKWSVRGRAVARVAFLLVAVAAIGTRQVTVGTAIWLVVTLVLGWIRPVGKSLRYWKPRRIRGTRFRGNRRAWVEPVLGIMSIGCVVVSGVLCLMDVLVYSLGLGQSPLVVHGFIDPQYLNALPSWQLVLVTLLVAIPVNLLLQVTSIAVILLLAAAATLRHYGRRFAVPDADEVQQKNTTGHIIYLRNFGDDGLKMPSSSLGRTSLTERFSVVRMQPFEEILARHLRNLGPFIGLVKPGTRIPELGAAKVARSDDTWDQQIKDWVAGAALVVIAATPAVVSKYFLWEISYLANEAAHVPVLLVLSPYKRAEIARRWGTFFRAAMRWPRFFALGPFAEHNSGAHFMMEVPGAGWVAWGARTRSEYTYATCLAAAFETVRSRQAHPGATTQQPTPQAIRRNLRPAPSAEGES